MKETTERVVVQSAAVVHMEIAIDPNHYPETLSQLEKMWHDHAIRNKQLFVSLQQQRRKDFAIETGKALWSKAPETLKKSCAPGRTDDQRIMIEIDNENYYKDDGDEAVRNQADNEQADFELQVHAFFLSNEEAAIEELCADGDDNNVDDTSNWTAALESLPMPHATTDGLWESLFFDDDDDDSGGGGVQKQDILQFCQSAVLFADAAVPTTAVHCNRLVLLEGPPGCGKTTLCRAAAHKLAVRMQPRFPAGAVLLEIHCHSLFSKWFSTSGKLVKLLFELIQETAASCCSSKDGSSNNKDSDRLVVVVMDEIESLAINRSTALQSDPTDSMRAVNALLTSLDRCAAAHANVVMLATTNLVGAMDAAFLDRADLTLHVGLPNLHARYEILRNCLQVLVRVGVIAVTDETKLLLSAPYSEVKAKENQHLQQHDTGPAGQLLSLAAQCKGWSGRSLRRLPLTAHARFVRRPTCSLFAFFRALDAAIKKDAKATASSVSVVKQQEPLLVDDSIPSGHNMDFTILSKSTEETEGTIPEELCDTKS